MYAMTVFSQLPASVERVTHARPPRNLNDGFQEIGRAGRRNQPSAILNYGAMGIASNVKGIKDDIVQYCRKEDGCQREFSLGLIVLKRSGMWILCPAVTAVLHDCLCTEVFLQQLPYIISRYVYLQISVYTNKKASSCPH